MGNETIFYRAKDTLIYFVKEELLTGSKRYVKPRFWKRMKLASFDADVEGLRIITVLIPDLKKGWKKEKLLKCMHAAIAQKAEYSEGAEVILHPEVQLMAGQTESFYSVFRSLAGQLIEDRHILKRTPIRRGESYMQTVVLIIGDSLFPEEQMQKFSELMQAYLHCVNHLAILHAANDNNTEDKDFGQEWSRWEEAVTEYTQELYYEYGLVAQIQEIKEFAVSRNKGTDGAKAALFIDFGYSGNIPLRMFKAGDIYLDVFSSQEKESLFKRKCKEISYISPRKYLDTVVKSGYDKLVNQGLQP